MKQEITSNHITDADGNPTGGSTYGVGICISWQHGPLGRGDERTEPNGAFTEGVILAAKDRIEFFQRTRFACETNAEAIRHLDLALAALERRTAEREARGVEGLHEE